MMASMWTAAHFRTMSLRRLQLVVQHRSQQLRQVARMQADGDVQEVLRNVFHAFDAVLVP